VFVPVMDERVCRVLGGTPYPTPLEGEKRDPGGITGARVPLNYWKLQDLLFEPGVADWDDPDSRGAWIWDLDW